MLCFYINSNLKIDANDVDNTINLQKMSTETTNNITLTSLYMESFNTVCSHSYNADTCKQFYIQWNALLTCVSLVSVIYIMTSRMRDGYLKLFMFYMVIDNVVKPIAYNAIN